MKEVGNVELWKMMQLDYVRNYLMGWSEGDWNGLSHTEDRLHDANTKLFHSLESVAPAYKENEIVLDAVLKYSVTYADAYLSTGIIMGMKLQELLEQEKQEKGAISIEDVIRKLHESLCNRE